MTGNVSFDLDGVLANFTRGILRIGHELFKTPVGGHSVQKTWNYHEWPALKLSKEQFADMWMEAVARPTFWQDLDPFNPSIMPQIGRISNRIFITNRAGIDPKFQSEQFLAKWGVPNARVFVAANKVPIAQEQQLVTHIDDYYPNCVDLKKACPKAYVALLWTQYNEQYHHEWLSMGGHIVLSVDEFLYEVDYRGLAEYFPLDDKWGLR